MSLIKNLFFVGLGVMFLSNLAIAQSANNWCGQVEMDQRYRSEHPDELPSILAAEQQLENETRNFEYQRNSRAVKVIPVVFHVLHINGPENIGDAQIFDQIRILNEDYNKRSALLDDVIPDFENIIGNANIEFRLAQIDPNGNATNGIDRIFSSKTLQGGDGAKLNPWPRNKYLNIWIVKEWASSNMNGVLAYAYLPASVQNSPSVDGIICLSQYVGSIGTGSPAYQGTLTHEIGHYLNLAHTWGSTNDPGVSTNCSDDDGISDTPNCLGTFSCNLSSSTCGSLDNIQNHMDYSDCAIMFTNGQVSKMNATLNSSVSQRNQLSTSSNLLATGVGQLTKADFYANRMTICQFESIDFTDESSFGATGWDWSFPSAQSTSSTNQLPNVTYETAGLFDVSLTATEGSSSVNTTKVGYIMVNPVFGKLAPFTEDFSDVTTLNHEDWYAENPENDEYLFVADQNNGFDASRCLRIENFGNTFLSNDALITTTYDLSIFTQVSLSFKVSYAQTSTADFSKLTLYVSSDCGQTWSPRWSQNGSALASAAVNSGYFTPAGNQDWKTINVSNISGNLLSQTSQFKLVFENKEGNNLYVDDFNVNGTYSTVAQLKYPSNGMTARANNETLFWKAMGGGVQSYEYELDTDPAFNTANLQSGTKNFIDIVEGPDTRFETSGLTNGQKYYWRVRLNIGGQPQQWSDVWDFTVAANGVSTQDILAEKYQVSVYPNPMSRNGMASFTLSEGAQVSVNIMDVVGHTNTPLANANYGAGTHVFNLSELKLSPGIYVLNINVNQERMYQKFVVQ